MLLLLTLVVAVGTITALSPACPNDHYVMTKHFAKKSKKNRKYELETSCLCLACFRVPRMSASHALHASLTGRLCIPTKMATCL